MYSDSSSSDSSLPDKTNYILKKRKMIHELEKTSDYPELHRGIHKNMSGSKLYTRKESNLLPLSYYLGLQEGIPLSPALAAKWIKDICICISFLHKYDYMVGEIDEASILIDERGQAGVLLPHELFIAPSTDKFSYFLCDTSSIGKLLFRFVMGSRYSGADVNICSPFICEPELENGLKLAHVLLSNSEDVRLSIAAIVNHPWIEKHSGSSTKQIILLD